MSTIKIFYSYPDKTYSEVYENAYIHDNGYVYVYNEDGNLKEIVSMSNMFFKKLEILKAVKRPKLEFHISGEGGIRKPS